MSKSTRKILIVDDDPQIPLLLSRMLRPKGIEVLTGHREDPEEAGRDPSVGTSQRCERTSCLSPRAVSPLVGLAFGCSQALTA